MILFQLPQRTVKIHADPKDFLSPYDLVINIKFGPEEFFGSADVTGRLRESISGAEYLVEWSTFQGFKKRRPVKSFRLPEFSYTGSFSGPPIVFVGSTATMKITVPDIDTFTSLIQKLVEILPAMFAPASNSPISILEIWGTANNKPFDVRDSSGTSLTLPGVSILSDYLDLALPYALALPRQILAAKRYLAQNYLLEYSSEFGNQFTGERLLNLCKSLEALIPVNVDSIDEMKNFLRGWKVDERYVDVFTSLRYLRSQLDVAHISYTLISKEAHQSIEKFLVLAEECMQALIITAVRKFISDNSIYPKRRATVDDPPAVRRLAKYQNLQSPHNGDLSVVPNFTDETVSLSLSNAILKKRKSLKDLA
jgi:hypothetical protein